MTWTTKTSDQFTRADQPINGTTLNNGLGGTETNTWTDVGTTDWFINTNRAFKGSGSGNSSIVSSTAATTAHRVSATAYLPFGGNLGLWGMYNAATNAGYLFYKNSGGTLILYYDGAAFNTVQNSGPVVNDADRMLLECTPGAQVAYVNGSSVLTGSNGALTSGVFGIYSEGTNGFDDIQYEVTASATPTQLVITTAPVGNQSGVALTTQPVVAVRDAGNATVTSDTSTVVASINVLTGSVTLGGTTSKAAVAGVATFTNLAPTGTGSYTLTFSDGALTTATTGTLYVGATQLAITSAPTTAFSKHASTIVVTAKDGGGVAVGNYTGTVAVTLNKLSGAGSVATLTGGTSSAAAVAGVATLTPIATTSDNGLVATSYTYTAAASGLTSATTATITPTVSESIAVTIT